jgi:hypothetical protein
MQSKGPSATEKYGSQYVSLRVRYRRPLLQYFDDSSRDDDVLLWNSFDDSFKFCWPVHKVSLLQILFHSILQSS